MKKLLFGLIATVFFGLGVNAQIKAEDYGKYHNDLINHFNSLGKSINDYKTIDEFTNDFYSVSIEKYPELKNDDEFLNFKKSFYKDFSSVERTTHFKIKVKELYISKSISKYTYDNLIKIIDSNSYETALEIISEMEKSKNLKDAELNSIKAFKSVLISSNSLWNISGKKDNTDEVIIADALGVIIWWYTGPFSAAAGAIYSVVINHCNC